jgi:RimJ/RimL family protein N-acetyltransferase
MSAPRTAVSLRAANLDDIPFIMACEQRPGYEPFVGRWPGEKHRAAMADAEFRYFIGCEDATPLGFAILHQHWLHPQNLYLKRIAMHDADRGHGRAFLSALHDWIFANTDTHRFWLEVAHNNARGQHLYESLGFVVEGHIRDAWSAPDGTRNSGIQMSLLKPDWLGRRT